MLHFRPLTAFALAVLLALLQGCKQESEAVGHAPRPPMIVVTTAMIGDVFAAVAGEHSTIEVLMGPGVDPHQFRASRADIAKLSRADVVVANGLLLEAKLLETLERLSSSKLVVRIGERIDPAELLRDTDSPGSPDPHIWMDPRRWATVVDIAQTVLSELSPEHAPVFASNAAAYRKELDALDQYAMEAIRSIPEQQRLLVTAHDAFGYFADRYGIQVMGVQGISTESEAGLRRIELIVTELVRRQVGAVFLESSVSDRNVRALIEGARARGHTVQIGGELFSDAMGTPGTYEGTYIGMMDHNITTIVRALGGTAPAAGLNGQLAAGQNRR